MSICSAVAAASIPLLDPAGPPALMWTVVFVTVLSGFISVMGVLNARKRGTEELEVRAAKVRIEEQLRVSEEALERLEQSVRLKQKATVGELSAGLAENLRITASALRMALEKPPDDERARRHALSAGSRIERLASEVLSASESSRGVGNAEVADVAFTARRLTRSVWEVCHEVRVLGLSRPVHVSMTRGALVQILVNLISNAVEASPYGGVIHIHVEATEGRVRICVDDDGPGIPEEIRQRIFDPYEGTKQRSSGLGLSLCRVYAARATGEICAGTSPEGGARIELLLPEAQPGTQELAH
ncbi:MAG: HAMP domain-containing histidine kinase [Proteobacteria bacterium]|nr:HAMP domain-containing histidine kinase [Pseudomonadota bacterium]